jgi:hypothetical protein
MEPTQPVNPPDQVSTSGEAQDITLARAALNQRNLNLALNYLERQLERLPGDKDALALMAQSVRAITVEECGNGDHVKALGLLKQLADRRQAARQARFQADAPATTLDDLVARDRDIEQIRDAITASTCEQAGPHIDAALRLADAAHHGWYTCRFNDRDKVREGLHELQWVHDRGPALSKDINGRFFQALDQLKSLVADTEWEPLLQEAGYASLRTEAGQ